MSTPGARWVRDQRLANLQTGFRIDGLTPRCRTDDSDGVTEVPEWRDWTDRETTPDQLRIEDVLETLGITGLKILHVGFGNSGLARRFCGNAQLIDGITIEEGEYRSALSLGIPNYSPIRISKYASDLVTYLHSEYDYIVDNNPTTFSCCRWHLATMLASYSWMLRPGGVLLTDKVGLSWTSDPNDPRWGLTESEWWELGSRYGLVGVRYTSFVIGLRKDPSLSACSPR